MFKDFISKVRRFTKRTAELINYGDSDNFLRSGELRILASSLSYTTLLSFIPFMALVLAIFQYVGGLDMMYPAVEAVVLQYFKEATGYQVVQFLRGSLKKIHSGSLGTASIVVLIFASYRLLSDADRAMNRIWHTGARKPLYKRLLSYWLLLLIAPLLLATYAGFFSVGNLMNSSFKLDAGLAYGLLWFWGLTIFYIVVPDVKVISKYALYCAFFASVAITTIQQSLALGVLKFIRYNKVYGSLAAVPVVLLWILAIWYVILIGAYVNYRLQKRAQA